MTPGGPVFAPGHLISAPSCVVMVVPEKEGRINRAEVIIYNTKKENLPEMKKIQECVGGGLTAIHVKFIKTEMPRHALEKVLDYKGEKGYLERNNSSIWYFLEFTHKDHKGTKSSVLWEKKSL